MPKIDLSMLNQRQTPAFYADVLANRPAAGFIGRIFVSTNTYAFYRDNGTSWDLIGGPGTGTITGSGSTGSIALWNGTDTITYDVGLLWDGPTNALTADKFIVAGGTSSQFLKANGTLDSNTYNTGSGAANQVSFFNGTNSITGSNSLWWDSVNSRLGINTNTPGASIDAHSAVSSIAQFNQTVATNNSLLVLQNSGSALWRLGNYYNAGANDFGVFDVIGAIQPLTIKKTSGQVLIGTSTVGSGKLVVASASSDNGIQIVGASAPSLRIDSAESGPTKRAGLGISTATNNFIQGSADRDFCIFNGSTAAASPILFGVYDAGAVNVQEAARISAARNFLIGTTTDAGYKLDVSGTLRVTGAITGGYASTFYGTSSNYFRIGKTDATLNYLQTNVSNGATSLEVGDINSTFGIIVGNANRLSITSAGKVGINFASPYNSLVVSGTSPANSIMTNPIATFVNSNGVNIGEDGTDALIGATNSGTNLSLLSRSGGVYTKALNVASTSNILIGTTTDAGQKLQVNGNALFASNITITNAGRPYFIALTTNANEEAGIKIQQSGNSDWYIGTSQGSASPQDLSIRDVYNARILVSFKANGVINFKNVPTSAAGLVSGDIYRTANVLNIVP